MNYSFEYIDIILLAMIAGFIFLRLRGILGKKTKHEENISTSFPHEFSKEKKQEKLNENNFDENAKSEFLKGAQIAYETCSMNRQKTGPGRDYNLFFGNSTSLGMPCVSASKEDRDRLVAAVEANPQLEVSIDLVDLQVRFGEDSIPCEIREGARDSLLNGRFDPLDELLEGNEQVDAVAQRLNYA